MKKSPLDDLTPEQRRIRHRFEKRRKKAAPPPVETEEMTAEDKEEMLIDAAVDYLLNGGDA